MGLFHLIVSICVGVIFDFIFVYLKWFGFRKNLDIWFCWSCLIVWTIRLFYRKLSWQFWQPILMLSFLTSMAGWHFYFCFPHALKSISRHQFWIWFEKSVWQMKRANSRYLPLRNSQPDTYFFRCEISFSVHEQKARRNQANRVIGGNFSFASQLCVTKHREISDRLLGIENSRGNCFECGWGQIIVDWQRCHNLNSTKFCGHAKRNWDQIP